MFPCMYIHMYNTLVGLLVIHCRFAFGCEVVHWTAGAAGRGRGSRKGFPALSSLDSNWSQPASVSFEEKADHHGVLPHG